MRERGPAVRTWDFWKLLSTAHRAGGRALDGGLPWAGAFASTCVCGTLGTRSCLCLCCRRSDLLLEGTPGLTLALTPRLNLHLCEGEGEAEEMGLRTRVGQRAAPTKDDGKPPRRGTQTKD